MPYFTYDTSVIVSRKIRELREMPRDFLLSAVVLMELTGSAADASVRKTYEELFHQYRRDKLLIVPTDDDWLLAAKIMFLLAQGRRRAGKGKLKRLPPGASQRLALDVLIAVSARRWKAQVVTENWTDFKLSSVTATPRSLRQHSSLRASGLFEMQDCKLLSSVAILRT